MKAKAMWGCAIILLNKLNLVSDLRIKGSIRENKINQNTTCVRGSLVLNPVWLLSLWSIKDKLKGEQSVSEAFKVSVVNTHSINQLWCSISF